MDDGLIRPRPKARELRRALPLACVLIVGGTASQAASLVGTTTSVSALESASRFYVHCVNGYYWVAYHDGTRPVLRSSRDASTWTSQGAIFSSFNPPAGQGQWAVRYQGVNIIAMGFNTGNNSRYYRNGTLNGDGSVTWNAADAVAQAGATLTPLNALVANQRPVHWLSTALGAGATRRGTQLNGPAWVNLLPGPPALAAVTGGGFSAAALFATGGADPDDLIVLRATTQAAYAAGNHRLVSVKFDSSLNTHDAAWYSVSTLNGGLPESATTEVKPLSDTLAHLAFAAVRDTSGNLHAVYVNRNDDVVHYRKAVGFSDTWSQISTDVTQTASVIDRVALTSVSGNNLYLFYSKADAGIYYRRFDGTTWGAESTIKAPSATPLQGALASIESASGCSPGVAWTEGSVSPYSVMFSLGVGSCGELAAVEGTGTISVTAPASFEMRFNVATGGAIDQFYDLAEDPGKTIDLAGSAPGNVPGLHNFGISEPGVPTNFYNSTRNDSGAKVDLLEATPTRVRVRQDAFYQNSVAPNDILPGVKGVGDYSVYPSGRTALRWTRTATAALTYPTEYHEILLHETSAAPLNNWVAYREAGATTGTPGTDAFVMAKSDVAGARTDFLDVMSTNWASAYAVSWTHQPVTVERLNVYWYRQAGSLVAGDTESWSFLTYFKPTNLGSTASPWLDPAVLSRSADYRTPATPTINASKGSQWQDADESTGAGGDFFNEAEAAYVFNVAPSTGLDFNLDGSTFTRYSPFFKIRQWRSAVAPQTITVDGVTKSRDVDYKADVKPVSSAVFLDSILWHSTLEDANALTGTPDIGSPGTAGAGVTYPPARYGAGAQISDNAWWITFPISCFDKAAGAVDFWFQPTWPSSDNTRHDIAGSYVNATNQFLLQKLVDNALHFTIVTSAGTSDLVVTSANYSWRAYDWVHIIIQWDDSRSLANQQRLYINGLEPGHTDPSVDYTSALLTTDTDFYIGNISGIGSAAYADGIYDEVYSYSLSAQDPSSGLIAHGGLVANPLEFLASPTSNATLSLSVVNGTQQGEYLYFGSDSRFRGLNVVLATAGAGTANLQWQFWDGTTWADLEAVTGFTDSTNNLNENGNVFWGTDPPGWSPSSFAGGADLYYVRAYVASGSYTTNPVESRITTDILLFQYCGDVTTNARFVFAPAVPTAVGLMSFAAQPSDRAVELEWQTGSELDNLGFHVYRGLTAEGPWTRLTSSLIPGLGSSPVGRSYSWLDSGLANGVTYYYRLEDVDTASVSTFHGPVSAVPQAVVPPPPPEGGGGGSGGGPTSTTCPSWVLAALGTSSSGEVSCTKHGDPDRVSFQVVSRDSRGATLELRTGGFWAVHEASGTVRVFVPGFDTPTDPSAPALAVRRALVEAMVGKKVRLESAEALDLRGFKGLRPSAAGVPEASVSWDGTVRPGRRAVRAPRLTRGYLPQFAARLAGVVFQGETKSAVVEMTPVRFDGYRQQLVLAERVRVRLAFTGREPGETGTGSTGRAVPRTPTPFREVLAQLHTTRRGLHAVGFEDLFPARQRGMAVSQLRLQRQGAAVGFRVEPATGVFGPGSVLYFFADKTAGSMEYSGEVAWELVRSASGEGMGVVAGTPEGGSPVSPPLGFASFERNRIYQSGLLEGPDVWLWEAMLGGSPARTVTLVLSGVETTSSEPVQLTLYLQGGSDSGYAEEHHVQVTLNGVVVGEGRFGGKKPYRLSLGFPASLLQDGSNTLDLLNVGDTGVYSLVFLDRVELSHPQVSVAREGAFEGSWAEDGAVEVGGVGVSPAVLDVTSAVKWVVGFETGPGVVRFEAEAGHRYVVVSREGLLAPRIEKPVPSTLRDGENQADYVVIAPREFLEAAEPLLLRRESQGLRSMGVSLEEIAEVFGQGQPSGEAIRDFLAYAYQWWSRPSPRYVVLLGDSTDDPRHFLTTSWASPLPALWAKTSYLWTVSDPALAAVNGDDSLPDLAIGRLPAQTPAEAEALVSKILAWEDSGQGLSGKAVLVADDPDVGGDFEWDVKDIQQSLLSGRPTEVLKLRELGPGTRGAIQGAFDDGASLVSFVGHGGAAVWASENVWNTWDAPSLLAQSEQPVLLTLNCLNGYFVAPNFESLSESLLKAEGRGVVAAFSPSGLSLDGPAHEYHRAVVGELVSGAHERLGDAVLAAQKTYAESGLMPELLTVYQLLGDPAMRIH